MADTGFDFSRYQQGANDINEGIRNIFNRAKGENINSEEYNKAIRDVNAAGKDVANMMKAGKEANKEIKKAVKETKPTVRLSESSADRQKRFREEIEKEWNDIFDADKNKTELSVTQYFKNNKDKYYDLIRKVQQIPDEFERNAKLTRLQEFIAYKPIDLEKFQPSRDPKGQDEYIREKFKEELQNQKGEEQKKQTTPTDTTTPETDSKKKDEDVDDDWRSKLPTWEDMDKRYEQTVNNLRKEKKSAQEFYSRIFSVPEWFPKGLDEFREAKKKYTNRPVYNKVTGKYEMGEGASPIAAKKELNIAKQVVDGLTKDVDRLEKAIPEEEENEKKEYEYVGWDNLPENRKNFFVNKFEDKIKSDEEYNEKFNSDLNNSVKYISGLQELVKDKKNNMTTKDDLFAYRDIKRTTRQGEPYVETNADKVLDAFIGDKFQNINDFLKKSPVDIENELRQIYASDLAKEDFEKDDYSETTERGASVNAKDVIEKQKETLDAIKNGDLKDANEKVDELKSAYEQSWKQQNTDMQEYSAAKRKLIKENAGNIARNVWFIIDLVTTMNRNAARLMPQGKYSPNLGNFETPALFQDYAAQLQGMRDTYNKANEKALMNDIDLETLRGKGAVDAQNEILKTAPEWLRGSMETHFANQRAWNQADINKMLVWANANANIFADDAKAKNDFLRRTSWFADKWASYSEKQKMDLFQLQQAMASTQEGKMGILLPAMKSLLSQAKTADEYRDVLNRIAGLAYQEMESGQDKENFLNTLEKVQKTLDAAQTVDNMFVNTLNAFNPLTGKTTTKTQMDNKGNITGQVIEKQG